MSAWPSPRVAVFVSSTIGECASERAAAREAIESIKCEPILFESIGARPHPARITYLEGLGRAQICIIVWKESYGYVDPALGISGVEDEFRIARERRYDILLYLKASAPNRDPRLAALIDEARSSLTTHTYNDEHDLRDQISSDITSLLGGAYIDQVSARADRLIDPSAVLTGTMPTGMAALERPGLEKRLDESLSHHFITWITGQAGAGKTILLAQWAVRHQTSYVNARGLSLRHLIHAMVAALSSTSLAPDSISLDGAADSLRIAWNETARWPLVIDDPSNSVELLRFLEELGTANGKARIVIGLREAPEASPEQIIIVPALSSAEAAELIGRLPSNIRSNVASATASAGVVLPLAIRKIAAEQASPEYMVFSDVEGLAPDPRTRELLAFIVASPEPLTLGDLTRLSSSVEGPVTLDGLLQAISFLLVDDGLGFRLVHDEIATDLQRSLARRPALQKFVSLRLAQFFARSKRFLPAFELYQSFDPPKALRAAYRAASQASIEGRFALAVAPMQFIADAKRVAGARIDLAVALIALSQAQEVIGNSSASDAALEEAESIATQIGDADLQQAVQDQGLIRRVRRGLHADDLAALRQVRERYKSTGRIADGARLANELAAILISVGDHEESIRILREARADFEAVGDDYGVYVATRNLVASLNMFEGGQKEAEELLQSLPHDGRTSSQLRERAWMCNILTRRYRLDGRLDDAIAVAEEAIEIGNKLSDPYVVALNRIGLGNALREKGELDAALEAFRQSGKEAQAINRKETDGLASRLAASVLIEKAESAIPYQRPKLYGEAEMFATHVIGLLKGSIAQYQAAAAFDSRGDARVGLGKKDDAFSDYAAAIKLFLELGEERALSLIHFLAANVDIDRPLETIRLMLSALPDATQPADNRPWWMLIKLIEEGIMKGHRQAAGVYMVVALKIAQKITTEKLEVGLWLRLLSLALEGHTPPDDGRMSFVLSAFLAHTRERRLSVTQLNAVTELTIGRSKAVRFRSVGGHLQTSVKIGPEDKVLIVLDDIDSTPATRFIVTALGCFFTAFREDIDREFLSSPMESGIYIRCSIVDINTAPEDIRQMLEGQGTGAVSVAIFEPRSGRPHELFVTCRPDVQERCQGDTMKGTELQFMYADILRAVLAIVLGGDIESEVLRPKLVSLIRKSIQ